MIFLQKHMRFYPTVKFLVTYSLRADVIETNIFFILYADVIDTDNCYIIRIDLLPFF